MRNPAALTPNTPDLQILVRREPPKTLAFSVQSGRLGWHDKGFGHLVLEGDAKILVQEELGRRVDWLSDHAMKGERGQKIAQLQLADMAVALFQKLPQALRELLWSQLGQIQTVQILSDEPYFPWELLKLQSERGEEGPFLCEAFVMTRWLRDFPQTVFALPLQAIAFVLLADDLPNSQGEREDLVVLAGQERITEINPTLEHVKESLSRRDFDGWHFSGHGLAQAKDPDRAELLLADKSSLTPENLVTAQQNLSRLRPLMFLNGCNTGRAGFSLTGMGGWAQQSLKAGVGAFVGTLWPVRDEMARSFARSFYQHFLGGEPIGEAARQARIYIRDQFPGDPAWLAYTVYAHPGALCTSASETSALTVRPEVGPTIHAAPFRIPDPDWHLGDSPGSLLRAEYRIVKFHGRDKEQRELSVWCSEGPAVRVRLYTGPGGMGKTRLAVEIARQLRQEGWQAGFLEPEDFRHPEAVWGSISQPGEGLLIIVDYAETRRELLVPLLQRLAATKKGPVRLILLARAALDWWEQLKTEGRGVGTLLSGQATTRHSLPPLAFGVKSRTESFWSAGEAFADRLNKKRPANAPAEIDATHFERVLLLHMAAYLAVAGTEMARGEDGILDEMLRHERRYWKRRAMEDKRLPESLIPGISRAMAAITLGGGVRGEGEAVAILRRLQAFAGHTGDVLLEVAHLLHECYPGDRWIEPVLPDLLGEHLVQREMERGADELLDLVLGPAAR